MRHRTVLSGLAVLVPCLLVVAALAQTDTVTLTLPAGDPVAGREAFVALSCTSCHGVAGERGFPDPVSANRGPTLGRHTSQKDPANLAMSIFDPSHEISASVRSQPGDELSPMGDFSGTMTVRQFIDLIAYVRSLR